MRRVDGCRSGGVGGGAYRIILAAAVLLAALPVAQPQVAKTGRVWTAEAMDPGFHPKHLAQFVKVMNDRNIFASTAVPTNIISVATTTDAQVLLSGMLADDSTSSSFPYDDPAALGMLPSLPFPWASTSNPSHPHCS